MKPVRIHTLPFPKPFHPVLRRLLTLLCLLLALPVLGVLAAWFALDAAALATLSHQFGTVLPGYALQSAGLTVGVALGVMALGTVTAAAVTLFDFPGRRVFEWALLLPLAMPAYVLAYAWTDALQFSGPLQTVLRAATGAQGALLARRAQPGRRHRAVRAGAVPLCLPADAHRAG